MVMCQCRSSVGGMGVGVDHGVGCPCVEAGKSLYVSLSFAMNLKLL